MRTRLFHISILLSIFTLSIANSLNAQCPACATTGNTWTVSGTSSTSYTVGTGQSLYIAPGGTYTGTVTLNGGIICNAGAFNPAGFTYTTGTFTNNGTATFSSSLVFNAGTINNCSSARITIAGTNQNFTVKGTLQNYGYIQVSGGFFQQGTTHNRGRIRTFNFGNTGPLTNYCHIEVTNNFTNSSFVYGTTTTVGRFNVGGTSSNSGTFGTTGQLDFCDATSTNGGKFDTNTGTVGGAVNVTHCTRTGTGCQIAVHTLSLTATPSTTSAPGALSKLKVVASGGFTPYTWQWLGGATGTADSTLVYPTANTTYSVNVTDAAGSVVTGTVTVVVNLKIDGTVTNATRTNANAGAIALTVTGGRSPFTYLWNNGSTAKDRSGLSAGIYSVTVTDANGQQKQATFYVGNAIEWIMPSGSMVTANDDGTILTRSGAFNDWCGANARSNNRVLARTTDPAPNHWVTFSVSDVTKTCVVGFASQAASDDEYMMHYRLLIQNGTLIVIEIDQDGFYKTQQIGNIANGDQLRMEINGEGIRFIKNNTLLYTSTVYGPAIYYLEADIETNGGSVRELRTSAPYTP
ncbi:MAG: SprB repeat-containing protein [Bacteroidia bacterium]|jgi:hypothetical protein|nr:SprB repeat-containing protein [Bacteroidia bacterium]